MLEITLRFTIADDTATDEALIAGFPHDLRAIANQVAQSWPGHTLDAALESGGRLARPARLEIDLAHGGLATVEVREARPVPSGHVPNGTPHRRSQETRRSPASGGSPAYDLDDALSTLVSPERLDALTQDGDFQLILERTAEALAVAGPTQARSAIRMIGAFAGQFVDLVAKDRSGYWVRLAAAPAVDPYFVCAEFRHAGAIRRVPLPQILPEAAESRRSFALQPEVTQVMTLLDHAIPKELEAVRGAGRAYLTRRREWLSRGRYTK